MVMPQGTDDTAVPVEQALTVIVRAALVAVAEVTQLALLVKIQVTFWPLVNDEVENAGEFVPTFPPFTCHWYAGVEPPLTGLALNVAEIPEHIGLVPDVWAIETAGLTELLTVTVTAELVAVGMLAQEELLVMIQVTASLSDKEEDEKEEEFVPAFPPFTCH